MATLLQRWSTLFNTQIHTTEPIQGYTVYTEAEWAIYGYLGRLLATR